MWCIYNTVNFLQNPHNRHPIARPYFVSLDFDYMLLQSMQCCMKYRVILDRIKTALECTCYILIIWIQPYIARLGLILCKYFTHYTDIYMPFRCQQKLPWLCNVTFKLFLKFLDTLFSNAEDHCCPLVLNFTLQTFPLCFVNLQQKLWDTWTHWGLNKMAAFLQITFSNTFSCIKTIIFWFKFH